MIASATLQTIENHYIPNIIIKSYMDSESRDVVERYHNTSWEEGDFNIRLSNKERRERFNKKRGDCYVCIENLDTGTIEGGIEFNVIPGLSELNPKLSVESYMDREAIILSMWLSPKAFQLDLWGNLYKAAAAFCYSLGIGSIKLITVGPAAKKYKKYGFHPPMGHEYLDHGNQKISTCLQLDCTDFRITELYSHILHSHIFKKGIVNATKTKESNGKKVILRLQYDIRPNEQRFNVVPLSIIDVSLYQILMQHPDLLKSLGWRHFEKLLADILETFGYNIELMQGTKDGGIDIIAFTNNSDFGPHKYLLQAKRWSHKIDVDVVKNVLFNHAYYKATKSCLAATTTFTKGAWNLAGLYEWQLELKDYMSIQKWIGRAYELKTRK